MTLLRVTESLSVQKTIALQTLVMVHKIVYTNKPAYLAERLKFRNEEDGMETLTRGLGMITNISRRLSTSRGGFLYRGSKLFNKLPQELRTEPILKKFKEGVKKWVIVNVKARPR